MDHLDVHDHAEVLDLLLSDLRAVVGDEDQLGLALSEALLAGAVAEDGLAGLEDEGEFGVDRL